MAIRIKRAYEGPAAGDGTRVLVDRLWPRGLKKEQAAIDRWMRDIAPSGELRKWFGHDVERWPEFRKRYLAELKERDEDIKELVALARKGTLTLVFAAKDEEHNNARVIEECLKDRLKGKGGAAK
jgi:uncharacterized protein YeaO (DUF488 family)